MAMHDWNQNGKKDMGDDYIEYQIYKDVTGQKNEPIHTQRSGNGMSTFGAIISVIAGLVLQAVVYMGLGIEVEDVPVFVIIVLWVVFSAIAAVVVDKIGL